MQGRGLRRRAWTGLHGGEEPGNFYFGLLPFLEIVLASHLMILRQSNGFLPFILAFFLRAFLSYRNLVREYWCCVLVS